MRVDVITLFPEMFWGALNTSMLRIAREKKLLDVRFTDIREFADDAHRSADDRPYGGGPGMVLKPIPALRAVRAALASGAGEGLRPGRVLVPCPRGCVFRQETAREMAREPWLIFLVPHYEGYDERIVEILGAERLSLGDFILTGGELPVLSFIDAVVRLLPGVLGDPDSARLESFAEDNGGWLEHPQYTRPAEVEGRRVPDVLLSGAHARVNAWRAEQSRLWTERRRSEERERGKS
jgi:tRNA (guanine37-N1)-methyltransferase